MNDKYKTTKDAEQDKSVRDQRNTKLAENDWTQVANAPMDKAIWATYRQTLHDISMQSGFSCTITWPAQL